MKKHEHTIALIALASLFGALAGCERSPTEPPSSKPGKRDYVWTIDTLEYPRSFQTLMRAIRASGPTNVYVVGHNSLPKGNMYRYNGQRWEPVPLTQSEGGMMPGMITLFDIHGFGPNDIYAVGSRDYWNPTPPPNFLDSNLIIRFDGVQWREVAVPRKRHLTNISGFKRASLWATGKEGSAYFFNGSVWNVETFPFSVSPGYTWGVRATSDGLRHYAAISKLRLETGETWHYFLRRTGSLWSFVDSFYVGFGTFSPKFGAKFRFLPSGDLYSIGYGIFRWTGETWQTFYLGNETATGMWGTRKEHLFLTVNNHLLHI